MRTRTCFRSARSSSISSRNFTASAAAFLAGASSASAARASCMASKAASRSDRNEATSSTARRMRSSRFASESTSDSDCGRDILVPLRGGLLERRLGLVHQCAKRGGIGERHIRQNLAVQLHASLLQAVHELAIRDFSRAARRADAYDPQRAEIALLEAPALVSIAQRLLNRLLRRPVQFALGEEKTFGEGKGLLAAIAPLGTTFNSGHVSSPGSF